MRHGAARTRLRFHPVMHPHRTILSLIATLPLAACTYVDRIPFLYHLDIHQGNIVSQEMVDQLKPGMNRRQVTFIMGSPLTVSPFHDDRWDYVYSNQPGGEERVQRRISLMFDQDELVGLQGDFKPGELPSLDASKDVNVDIPKIERDQSLWGHIKSWFGNG
ncbi:outer membrane protein assembly factor BamE [Methylococcus sp. Mc7]|nr:outer membrane protein assembly factor BamE [Methylococcus sp. Mc7]